MPFLTEITPKTEPLRGAGNPVVVSPWWLLSVHIVLPIIVLLVVADLVSNRVLLRSLLADPNELAWFTLIFVLPHIFAGFFSFLDKDYIVEYRGKLLRGAQLGVLATLVLPLVSINLAVVVFSVLTMTHVAFQQSGIAKSLMAASSLWHSLWQWSTAAVASVIYLNIYLPFSFRPEVVVVVLPIALLLVTFFSIKAAKKSRSPKGTAYLWLTHSTLVAACVFVWLGYPLLAIVVPRIVHDATAFICYVVHDQNRAAQAGSNYIYKVSAALRVPVFIASPLLAFSLAAVFQIGPIKAATVPLVATITLMHYYTENSVWRTGTLHRQYLTFTKI